MTKIKYVRRGTTFHFEAKGHADFNPGNDIVCSAISILSQTLIQQLIIAESDKELKSLDYSLESGKIYANFATYKFSKVKIMNIVETILTGYELLQKKYPENVKIL